MRTFNIAVIPGDGIGPEVVGQAVRVLRVIEERSQGKFAFNLQQHLIGGAAIDATGKPLPDSTFEACKVADAILLGAVGGPKWPIEGPIRPEQSLLTLRKELNLYANIRPIYFPSDSLISASPLKESVVKGVNIIMLRELIGGAYFGQRKEANAEPQPQAAWDTMAYSVEEVKRVARVAAHLALSSNPPSKVFSIDKANVLASSRLWRSVVSETLKNEYPQLTVEHYYVDATSMYLVTNPRMFNGVLLTENLFGDILSDQGSGLVGSLGLAPSASLSGPPATGGQTVNGLYEPIHGSAPTIANQNIANPLATILSAALLLRYSLGLEEEAKAVEQAVRVVLNDKSIGGLGLRTKDIGGESTTTEIGDRVVFVLKNLPSAE